MYLYILCGVISLSVSLEVSDSFLWLVRSPSSKSVFEPCFNFLWPCLLCFRISDLNNIVKIRELRFFKNKLWFKFLKISPFLSSVCPSICPSVPFPCIYPWYKVDIFTSIIFYPAFPEPSVVLSDLSSHLRNFLPGLMEHCHGDHMTSLHWEWLPRKPYDVIALEAVAMVTELAEVTGKGFVIWWVPGNVPINCNKEETFLYIFRFQGGLPVTPGPHCFMSCNFSGWAVSTGSGILPTCGHQTTRKWRNVVLWFCIRWDCSFCCSLFFPLWFPWFLR